MGSSGGGGGREAVGGGIDFATERESSSTVSQGGVVKSDGMYGQEVEELPGLLREKRSQSLPLKKLANLAAREFSIRRLKRLCLAAAQETKTNQSGAEHGVGGGFRNRGVRDTTLNAGRTAIRGRRN